MRSAHYSFLASLGLACLASSVFLVRKARAPRPSILDRVYS